MKTLPVMLSHSGSIMVDETVVVPQLPKTFAAMADMPSVFATAYMVAFVEATCIDALAPFLEEGEGSVGTHIDISHVAPTPVGLAVTAEVELAAVEGRRLHFRVRCRDEAELIGEGTHERFVIDRRRFDASVETKAHG